MEKVKPGEIAEEEKRYWVGFSAFPQIGPVRFRHLLKNFGSAREAWRTSKKEFTKIGFSDKLIGDFEKHRNSFNFNSYFLRLKQLGIEVVLGTDESYPKLLKEADDSPYILYVRTNNKEHTTQDTREQIFAKLNAVNIAVVGTRKMTAYGKEVTERLVTGLVDNNCTIVSGLALGIDSVAHRTALKAGGFTVAVLGGGLDNVYPPSNRGLADEIIRSGQGILISEYPLGFPYLPQNFPSRNRIIAGISRGVLVIEGTERSGTLLTASAAAKYGREVFAVPGPITSLTSKAPHFLLRNGAKLTENAVDVLEELGVDAIRKTQYTKRSLETEEESRLFNILKNEPLDIDSIVRISGLDIPRVMSTLTMMELRGILKNIGGIYTIING